jgi:hypothetical protein
MKIRDGQAQGIDRNHVVLDVRPEDEYDVNGVAAPLEARMQRNPGLDFMDIFHGTFFGFGPRNYRDNNGGGPSAHVVSRKKTETRGFDQFHFDWSYPYGPGFFFHSASAFRSIVHLVTGPHELPYPKQYP